MLAEIRSRTDEACWFCLFKQKTAYEMRISDWSSDVCSSDLPLIPSVKAKQRKGRRALADLGSALTHYSDPILQKPDASLIPGIAQAVIWLAVSQIGRAHV